MADEEKGARRARVFMVITLVLVGIGSLLWGVGALALAMPALFSVMMFDAPGSEGVIWTNLLAWSMFTAPGVLLLSAVTAWIPAITSMVLLRRKRYPGVTVSMLIALALLALPLINVTLFAIGWVGLDVYCDGAFSCGGS